jgi:hypothetical protein
MVQKKDLSKDSPFLKSAADTLDWTGLPHIQTLTVTGPFSATGPGDTPSRRRVFVSKPAKSAGEDACAGKTLYFGSCSVLQVPERQIAQFRAQTKAECLVGFNRDIDWLASAALDLILLQAMALKQDPGDVERSLRHEYGDLAEHLGLQMIYDAPPEAEAQPA